MTLAFATRIGTALLVGALSASCAHSTPPPSIQARCGVGMGAQVTQSQAVCIARLAGLEEGLKPWVVRQTPYPAGHLIEWRVSNTLNSEVCFPTPGRMMVINAEGGEIIGTVPVHQICDPIEEALPNNPSDYVPLPTPSPTPRPL